MGGRGGALVSGRRRRLGMAETVARDDLDDGGGAGDGVAQAVAAHRALARVGGRAVDDGGRVAYRAEGGLECGELEPLQRRQVQHVKRVTPRLSLLGRRRSRAARRRRVRCAQPVAVRLGAVCRWRRSVRAARRGPRRLLQPRSRHARAGSDRRAAGSPPRVAAAACARAATSTMWSGRARTGHGTASPPPPRRHRPAALRARR